MQRVLFLFLSLLVNLLQAQQAVTYEVDAEVIAEERKIKIRQQVHLEAGAIVNDTLYFNDWNHAYSSSKTPLALWFAEEFDRSFYLAPKNRLGQTVIQSIKEKQSLLSWFRPVNHPDQIGILIPPVAQQNGITLYFEYDLILPDAKFSKYGYNENKKSIRLTEWLLTYTGPSSSLERLVSNLDIDDQNSYKAHYKVRFETPDSYEIIADLPRIEKLVWEGSSLYCPTFVMSEETEFVTYSMPDGAQIFSDIGYPKQLQSESQNQFERIYAFLRKEIPDFTQSNFIVSKGDYNKRPFYGLNQLPSFISPFSKSLLNELKVIKAFSRTYVQTQMMLPKRKNQWILEGLPIYLVIKYIETYHPNLRFLGDLSKLFYLRTYGIAKMSFNDSFMTYTEFMLRNNLHQEAATEKGSLTRFNERITVPYHVGIGLRYLESYMNNERFEKLIKQLISSENAGMIQSYFKSKDQQDIQWFYDTYINQRWGVDFQIKEQSKDKDSIELIVTENNKLQIPVKLSRLKNKEIVSQMWVYPNPERAYKFDRKGSDQIAINPFLGLPELNKENNWKSTQQKIFKKPLSFRLVKDTEVPDRNQLFANPISNYNAYDGISFGGRFHNKKLTRQNFQMDFRPQYSFLEENLVGSYRLALRINSLERKNFLTTLSLNGTSFHYDTGLRYHVVAPQLAFFFRTPDFRSNLRQALSASWYNISKDIDEGIETSPEYGVLKLTHLYSDKATLKYLTMASSLELSNSFSKASFNFDYRKLFPSGRQFQVRFFAGKFIRNAAKNNNFFDFSLTRPNDYLYQYQYLGRSETSGFFSQQFILAEGGLKANLTESNVSDYLFSTNLMMSLWKWIEVYGDVALAKNLNQPIKKYWGTGIRLNLVPDYLEMYFPIYNQDGLQLNDSSYIQNIRFVLTVETKQLAALFTRKWF